jgi:pimeloyl-ACP methyl ester carboxylesterase
VKQAETAGDKKSLALLKKYGPPIKGQYKGGEGGFKGLTVQRKIMEKYGGYSVKKSGFFKTLVLPMLRSREYTIGDLIGIFRGYKLTLSTMWPTVTNYNFRTQCRKFKMPYYIFQGRLDKNTPSDLVEEFYVKIEAPDKALIWFENSAHGPLNEEPERFKALLREKLKNISDD